MNAAPQFDAPPANSRSTGIEIKNVNKQYGNLVVLSDISLSIKAGEFVSFVGPSGCGKSTLLKIIHGLVPPTAGSVTSGGVEVTSPTRERAMVFQSDSLMPWLRIIDNVGFGLELGGTPRKEARRRSQAILDLVGLGDFARYFPRQLSGGMRQRANLARALAIEPGMLLMDEPFAALDAQTREVMQEELLRIWSQTAKTVVFITHQIDEAVLLSDRVVVMGSSPGVIRDIIPIDFPRPRTLEIKRSTQFNEIVNGIWHQLEADARREAR